MFLSAFRRIFTATILLVCTIKVCGQQSGAIGFHLNVNEFMGDISGNRPDFYQFKFNRVGAGFSLQQYLSKSFNLVEYVGFSGIIYQNANRTKGVDANLLGLQVQLKYKLNNDYLLKEKSFFAPFLIGGLGFTNIESRKYINNPSFSNDNIIQQNFSTLSAGYGVRFQFTPIFGIDVSSIFHMPINDAWDGEVRNSYNDIFLQHNVGLVFNFKNKTSKTTTAKPINNNNNNDTDGDSVKDKDDACPNTPKGVRVDYFGCPVQTKVNNQMVAETDSDNDGVPDSRDNCPRTVKGTRVDYFGCPVTLAQNTAPTSASSTNTNADSDNDGIIDASDKCPNTPVGTAVDVNGCPVIVNNKDSDGDGVKDSEDKCPTTFGDYNNSGCPVIKEETKKRLNFAMRGINFETNSHQLVASSYFLLNEVVEIMKEYPDYSLRMTGHTDNVGDENKNLKLSQRRVETAKKYLTSKGVAANRIEAIGYGETKPKDSNATSIGRAENRRVELELFLR